MKSIKSKLILFFVCLTALASFSSGFVVYQNYLNYIHTSIDQRLMGAVYGVEAAVDLEKTRDFMKEGGDSTSLYHESLKSMHKLKESLGMVYIYTLSEIAPNRWVFVLDTGIVDDPDDSTYMYELEEPYGGQLMAIENGAFYAEKEFVTDEWGTYRSAFLPVYDASGQLITVIGADLEASEIKAIQRNVFLVFIAAVLISLLATGLCSIWIAGQITKPLNQTTDSLKEIASGQGDLSLRLNKTNESELGVMVDSYNSFLDMLNGMLKNIVSSSSELQKNGDNLTVYMENSASAVEEISANISSIKNQIDLQSNSVNDSSGTVDKIHEKIDNLQNVIDDQSSAITESSAAIEQMVGNISAVSNNMEKLSSLFKELKLFSDEGTSKIAEVLDQVKHIALKSETLQEANTIIAGIASQTNLLAMNAAIEAAHAGEAGKGFSVVADEIRKLAEQSSLQSSTIGNSLKEVLDSIQTVVTTTADAEQTFEKVIHHVQVIDPLEQQVKEALSEQKTGSGQILEALSMMKQVTVEVRDGSLDIKSGSDQLKKEVETLNRINDEVRNSMQEIEDGASGILESTSNGTELVAKNHSNIEEVRSETAKFTLK